MTAITDFSSALLEQLAGWLPQQRWFAATGALDGTLRIVGEDVGRTNGCPIFKPFRFAEAVVQGGPANAGFSAAPKHKTPASGR